MPLVYWNNKNEERWKCVSGAEEIIEIEKDINGQKWREKKSVQGEKNK